MWNAQPANTHPVIGGQLYKFKTVNGSGRFEQGLAQAIDAVDGLLKTHFTLREGQANPDELPNHIDLR